MNCYDVPRSIVNFMYNVDKCGKSENSCYHIPEASRKVFVCRCKRICHIHIVHLCGELIAQAIQKLETVNEDSDTNDDDDRFLVFLEVTSRFECREASLRCSRCLWEIEVQLGPSTAH